MLIIGRYLLDWQLDRDSVFAQLVDAALETGLRGGEPEARATIRSGLKAGQRNPRDPDELLSEMFGSLGQSRSKGTDPNISHTGQGVKPFGSLGQSVSSKPHLQGSKPCL